MARDITGRARVAIARAKLWVLERTLASAKVTSAEIDGVELCEEERDAMRAGAVAGVATARRVLAGATGGDLDSMVEETIEAACDKYARMLKEAANE